MHQVEGASFVRQSTSLSSLDFDTLYQTYWKPVLHFCVTRLATCPDGTAEEAAQDVFLAAYQALADQRYRGDSALSTWLFGIARNLCAKLKRDTYRRTVPVNIRQLEREVARLEDEMAAPLESCTATASKGEELTQAEMWLVYERSRLPQKVREAVVPNPPEPVELDWLRTESQLAIQDSWQELARRDRQSYQLLHMHVVKAVSVREIAALQGMSRSAVQRQLTQAKSVLRARFDAVAEERAVR